MFGKLNMKFAKVTVNMIAFLLSRDERGMG
jgi:hypothetical protein